MEASQKNIFANEGKLQCYKNLIILKIMLFSFLNSTTMEKQKITRLYSRQYNLYLFLKCGVIIKRTVFRLQCSKSMTTKKLS